MKLIKLIPLLLLTIAFVTGSSFKADEGYRVGDKVADFSLKNVDGKMVSLADYKAAKGFIVVFTCNHCPYAKMYEERIMQLDQKYASKGYPVIAINPNDPIKQPEDSFDKMVARSAEKGYSFPYLLDETQEVAATFGAKYTPHVFVLKKGSKGSMKVAYIGAIDDNYRDASAATKFYVESAVEAIDAGKAPAQPSVKGVGCTIKWKS